MNKNKQKLNKRNTRHRRVRSKLFGTQEKPRLSVFRSNKNVYLQLINDTLRKTILSVSDNGGKPTKAKAKAKTKSEKAKEAGKKLAELAVTKKITTVVFDKGGYKYHGRVKAIAEGAREGGLKF